MQTRQEIAPGIHLISEYNPRIGITFNQYLLLDEQPTLVSAGSVQMVEGIRRCIDEVTDARGLRYIVVPHFEADECGALTTWQGLAPAVEPVVGAVCARQLTGFGLTNRVKVVEDGEVVKLGRMRLRCLTVGAEMHLWDGIIVYEASERILFSSDFFSQRGETPLQGQAFTESLVGMFKMSMPSPAKAVALLEKVRGLSIRMIATGHGFPISENIPSYFDAVGMACLS